MASSASLVAFVVEQLGKGVTAKRMFGEYGLYREGVLVALFCDDQLFMKPTPAVRELLSTLDAIDEAPPYPSAKPAYRISDEHWDNADLMSQLATLTASELAKHPAKPAKRKAAKQKTTKRNPAKRNV